MGSINVTVTTLSRPIPVSPDSNLVYSFLIHSFPHLLPFPFPNLRHGLSIATIRDRYYLELVEKRKAEGM